ncbi:hypothetical protein LEM8419_00594 [Neolewinella maritima]|uniref:PKD domain-containing protein n=1 Tax=Neolewinella maritima TaxID=1383882 RepID=A0ABM9AX37_9BACT|nr:PKD domain-containing protein [Neolewinella maritima]CAH0999296.1 hypothetical protein LEM8419_00594 [Neolewinella maritima]
MAFICSTGHARPYPACPLIYLIVCLFLFTGSSTLLATGDDPTAAAVAPTARRIAPQTVTADQAHQLVLNGAFTTTSLLSYSARRSDGSPLPSWMKIDPLTGTLAVTPPTTAVGQLYHLTVTATTTQEVSSQSSFYLLVDHNRYVCNLDANTDRLGRILDCTTGTATLRGHTSTGSYRWTGPNGFTSTEAEPVVNTPGLYQLTTVTLDGSSCPRRSIVEVRAHHNNCVEENNHIPKALITLTQAVATTNEQIELLADGSTDSDGEVVSYRWSWAGGSATGPNPQLQLPAGQHEVILTVMDNEGAKSTDRVMLQVEELQLVENFWLEAECAAVGTNWTVVESTSAAAGRYVMSSLSSMDAAPADAPANYVRFSAFTERAASYQLMARVAAFTNQHDSYWLRVNGGAWVKWNNGFKLNAGFQWVAHPTRVELQQGNNTVDIAYREPDTRLDKLLLSVHNDLPTGMGETAEGCQLNEAPVAVAAASSYQGIAPLTVTLDASGSTDADDNIYSYRWAWNGGSAEGIVAQRSLPAGTYAVTLTVSDDKGASDTDVISIQVDAPPPTAENGPEYWLEAECAAVGSNWTTMSSSQAANGKYVVVERGNSYSAPPADLDANRVRFVVSSPTANQYRVFARIDAPSNLDDSYYVRLNGGDWFKWSSGIEQGSGFRWNAMPGELHLQAGSNTVDFAYREDGARLDKLFLTPVKNGSVPRDMGEFATNCGTPADVWMEAECATASGDWEMQTSSTASGSTAIAYGGERNMTVPASGATDQQLSFPVVLEQNAVYHLFLRLNAFDRGHNSLWVKVDDGSWMKFWQEVGGRELLTTGYEWRKVNHDGQDRSFELSAGSHTITIANRESGTPIDKLYLSPSSEQPSGFGRVATNCGGGTTTSREMGMLGFTTTTAETADEPVDGTISLYPNPATSGVTVALNSTYQGRVQLILTDATGRRIRTLSYRKKGAQLQQRIGVASLPAGLYQLTILQGDQRDTQTFVKQ